MTSLKKGDTAPVFTTTDQDGNMISLKDLKGKKVILFFYPKDDTMNCVKEVCNLRDNYSELRKEGYEVYGVSCDNEKSHTKFIKKYNLPFTLLTDVEKKIVHDYEVYGPKQMFGIKFEGIYRTTFLIDEEGIIEDVITKVKTKEHHTQILSIK